VHAVVSAAENLAVPARAFELVTIGNTFHRLRREAVADNAFRWLQRGRCIARSSGPAHRGREMRTGSEQCQR
jgi:hypothetical protein